MAIESTIVAAAVNATNATPTPVVDTTDAKPASAPTPTKPVVKTITITPDAKRVITEYGAKRDRTPDELTANGIDPSKCRNGVTWETMVAMPGMSNATIGRGPEYWHSSRYCDVPRNHGMDVAPVLVSDGGKRSGWWCLVARADTMMPAWDAAKHPTARPGVRCFPTRAMCNDAQHRFAGVRMAKP